MLKAIATFACLGIWLVAVISIGKIYDAVLSSLHHPILTCFTTGIFVITPTRG